MAKAKRIPIAMGEVINKRTGKFKGKGMGKIINTQKHDHEIVLHYQGTKDKADVRKVFIRFGKLQGDGNYRWDTTMDMGPVKINPGQPKTLARVDADQLPNEADHFQILCEIVDRKYGHSETLVTTPTFIPPTGKL